MPLPAILAGLGGGAQLLGGLFGAFNQPETTQINPYFETQMAELQNAYANAMGQYQAQLGQAQRAQGAVRGAERETGRITGEVGALQQPGENDWYDQFLGNIPGYQEIAGSLAESATEQLGRSLEEQTQLATQQAVTQAQDAFAGARGGAAQAAMGQAIAQPMAQAQTQLAGQKAGIESGIFGQLAGAGQQLGAQAQQADFANALQTLMAQLQGVGQVGGMAQGRAGQAMQGAGIAGQMATSAQGQRTQLADPIFQQDQRVNPFAAIGTGLQGAADVFANLPSYAKYSPTGTPQSGTYIPFSDYREQSRYGLGKAGL